MFSTSFGTDTGSKSFAYALVPRWKATTILKMEIILIICIQVLILLNFWLLFSGWIKSVGSRIIYEAMPVSMSDYYVIPIQNILGYCLVSLWMIRRPFRIACATFCRAHFFSGAISFRNCFAQFLFECTRWQQAGFKKEKLSLCGTIRAGKYRCGTLKLFHLKPEIKNSWQRNGWWGLHSDAKLRLCAFDFLTIGKSLNLRYIVRPWLWNFWAAIDRFATTMWW